MDCERALEAVLEAQDLGRAAVPDLAEALGHCETCPSCRATARAFAAISEAPAPSAPTELTDRVLAAVAVERAASIANAAIDAADRRDGGTADDVVLLAMPPARSVRQHWLGWTALAVSAAAVILMAALVGRAGLASLGMLPGDETTIITESAAPPATGPQAGQPYVLPTPGTSNDSLSAGRTAAETARFILYDGRVWRYQEGMTEDRSNLALAGDVRTDLGTGDTDTRDVYERPGDANALFVEADDDTMYGFTLVTRLYQGRRFAQMAERGLEAFGEWPRLPASIPEPESADGSPVFKPVGTDDLGATVYVRRGTEAVEGFAVAPGTAASDPAAGNPNWTWWVAIVE